MQKKWTKWVDICEKVIVNFTAALMLLMVIIVSYQVFARYVIKSSPFWIEEISINFLMWIGLLSAAGGTWKDTHMDLEMLVIRLPKAVQVWLGVFSDILIAAFSWLLLQYGIELVSSLMMGTLSTLPIPVGYTYMVLPFSGGLMVIFSLIRAANRLISFYVFDEVLTKGVASHG